MGPMESLARHGVLLDWARVVSLGLELIGVTVILIATVVALAQFLWTGGRAQGWAKAYDRCRANLGRGILLGLELLVGADIIATVTSPITFESVGLLAAVVAIRTFLSFALETEIEGEWPWRRRAPERAHPNADEQA